MYNIVNSNDEYVNNFIKLSNDKLTSALAIFTITDKIQDHKIALKYCIEALNSFKYIFKHYRFSEELFEYIMETFDYIKLFFLNCDKGLKLILINEKKYIEKFILSNPNIFNFKNKEKYPYTNFALDSLFNKN